MNEGLKKALKSIGIYHSLQLSYRSALASVMRLKYLLTFFKYKGSGFTCNFCGAKYNKFVPNYPARTIRKAIESNRVIAGYGPNVFCPNCLSKNRERLVKAVLENYLDIENKTILHFSPEKRLFKYLNDNAKVTTIDLEPQYYKNIDPNIQFADAMELQFKDESFDLVVANHILEHIPDDNKAMKEIFRVLKSGGIAVLQVPWSTTLENTIEDPFIRDAKKQAALYGQNDHVRIYTLKDYNDRLVEAGFTVRLLPYEEVKRFKIYATQKMNL